MAIVKAGDGGGGGPRGGDSGKPRGSGIPISLTSCGIDIDTVYQRVLVLANKEQRGYITPQEFNLYANQVQMEILNQYFYDINQWGRQHGNNHETSDMLDIIYEKLACLTVRQLNLPVTWNSTFKTGLITIPSGVYKLGSVFASRSQVEVEEVNYNEYQYMQSAPLTKPTMGRPVYVNRIDGLNIYPRGINRVDIQYIKTLEKAEWGYFVVNNKALHDVSLLKTTHFELHASEETELVYKILKLAGVSMKRDDILNAGQGLETSQIQQEKQ